MRAKDGSGEVELRNYKALPDPELMGDEVMKHMLRGCSTRDYDGAITHLAGKKMILGIRSGDTENSEVVKDLFNDLEDRGLKIDENTLFFR